ncbi:MAG: phosphoglycerate dehydrogenase [Gammaproteobacteria bacterium]|nr:phosphoglycerate dehydrogenase [Gammaproteobacteria bacterium]
MTGNVLITAESVASCRPALDRLEQAGCRVDVVTGRKFEERWFIDCARDAHALVFSMDPIGARIIDALPHLKIIARPGVGLDTVDVAACTRRRIPVTIASGLNAESVADYTFGLLLAAARGIVDSTLSCRQRQWTRYTGTEVWNKTLTIVGPGRIGRAVARRARGFDMRVLGVTRTSTAGVLEPDGIELVDLATGLASADFVSLHAPLTPATRHLMNRERLALLRPGAFLINTARGGLVDEHALVEALQAGHVAGAAVDVLEDEGAGSSSRLPGTPGVLVTPHTATYTREAVTRVSISVADAIIAVLQGGRPQHVANPEIYNDD